MEMSDCVKITQILYAKKQGFFTTQSLRVLTGIKKDITLQTIVHRLVQKNILSPIEKGKFLLVNREPETFLLANLLYAPSYISLESALNFYGILSQFPYEVTSVTEKKPCVKTYGEKDFSYRHLQSALFFGYQKTNGFLIAYPEKCLLDQVYLGRKLSFEELDFSRLNKPQLRRWAKKYPQTRLFHFGFTRLQNYL